MIDDVSSDTDGPATSLNTSLQHGKALSLNLMEKFV